MRFRGMEIVEKATEKVIKFVEFDPPKSENTADRIEDGANRNLDHDRFYTVLIPVEEEASS